MKKKALIVILTLFIILCVGFGFFMGTKLDFDFSSKTPAVNMILTVKEILPNAEYSSLMYHYSAVVTHSEALNFFNYDIPLTEKKLLYTIDGTIKLGFNGEGIHVDAAYNQIILRMPKIKILSHEVYPETFRLYDERSGLFNWYSVTDFNAIQMIHKQEQEDKVNENDGLFTQARQSAEQQFTMLLESLPGIKNKYTIVFEWEL